MSGSNASFGRPVTWVRLMVGNFFHVKQNNSKHHLKSKVFVARQLKVLEAWLQNNPGVHGALVLRLLHQVG